MSVENLKDSTVRPQAAPRPAPPRRLVQSRSIHGPGMVQIITLVLWVSCVVVGLLGMWLTHPPAAPPPAPIKKPPPPLKAEVLNVDLAPMPLPPPAPRNPSEPPPPAAPSPASPPPLPEVAAPSAAMAFAQPIEGAVRLVPLSQANPARLPATVAPVVQRLTYGLGEGRQPEPDYPQEAVEAGEQGVVGVRFRVDTDGQVVAAQITSPCPWPLLNESALRAVRDTWHFGPGPPRLYEVAITFHLNQL